jgi:anti-sigma factor RsiW
VTTYSINRNYYPLHSVHKTGNYSNCKSDKNFMTVSRQPQINEELLSAYLDDAVTDEERALVEVAIATDPAIAWQVDSLRQTIHLLQELPPLALPRTFTIEAILADARATETGAIAQPAIVQPRLAAPKRTTVATPAADEQQNNWWPWFQQLWQGGNLQLRNAAAVALTLLVVLFAGDRLIVSNQPGVKSNQPMASVATTSGEAAVTKTAPESTPTVTRSVSAASYSQTDESNAQTNSVTQVVETPTTQRNLAQAQARTGQSAAPTFSSGGEGPGPRDQDLAPSGPQGDNVATMAADSFTVTGNGGPATVAKQPAVAAAAESISNVTQQQTVSTEVTVTTASTTVVAGAEVTTNTVINTATTIVTNTVTETQTITSTSITPTVNSAAAITGSNTSQAEAPSPIDNTTSNRLERRNDWLTWAQLITAMCTVVLASLWWRSRR